MKNITIAVASAVALALTTSTAWAGTVSVPEPGMLPLFAISAVGGLVIWARNRKKK